MILRTLILALSALVALPAMAQQKATAVLSPEASQYPEHVVMLHTADDGKESLRTPIARYKDKEGRIVDLVGAIHLADARYYRALNRAFARYDKVLYEMVDGEDLPEMTRIARKVAAGTATQEERNRLKEFNENKESGVAGRLLGSYYAYMAEAMQLAQQAEVVDYGRTNLVYADMSSEEFSAAMAERGESWLTLVLDSLREGQSVDTGSIFGVATDATSLRRLMCRQLAASSHSTMTEQRAIIVSRNERCMHVLDQVLADTQNPTRTAAIFYGAMHLRDMHRRMLERGFTLAGVQWITAIRVEK